MPTANVPVANPEEVTRVLKLGGHVGFGSLPDQLVNKRVKNGFVLNIMCIGETGIGKSTLMDSLFNTSFDSSPVAHTLPNVKLKAQTYELQESGVRLSLTICDSVGYGDQINKEDSFKAVDAYIDAKFEEYLQNELKIDRSLNAHDKRVHACLYYISPTGHGLKAIDLLCMKKIDTKVNIIPIIAKADTITKADLKIFRAKIVEELAKSGVQIYKFPTEGKAGSALQEPFAVVGSSEFVRSGGKLTRGRQYPWGTVLVENETHSDFVMLREMLIRTHMEDMCETTHSKHYELYRQTRLEQMGFRDANEEEEVQRTVHDKASNHLADLQAREDEIRVKFVKRVKEKETELRETESSLHTKFEQLKIELAQQEQTLGDMRKKLEEELIEFNCLKAKLVVPSHSMTLGKFRNKK